MGKINIISDWEDLFGKRISVKEWSATKIGCWRYPTDDQCTEICGEGEISAIKKSLADLKLSLNATKSSLTSYEFNKWRRHTKQVYLCSELPKDLSRLINAELCTQAWVKFCTILKTFDLLQELTCAPLESVHLCEGPGAFVTCLNHLMTTEHSDRPWSWLASTLNPYYEGNSHGEMIPDDVLIRHTTDKWCFGGGFSGDLTTPENITDITKAVLSRMDNVQLVTADGSIDCSHAPADQEMTVSRLILSEILSAMLVLGEGGALVIKFFTLFEEVSVAMVYLLCCVFCSVDVIKPGPSKGSNSEVYVVCRGFIGRRHAGTQRIIQQLTMTHARTDPLLLFPLGTMPLSFLQRMVTVAEYFTQKQKDAIASNVSLWGRMDGNRVAYFNRKRRLLSRHFVQRFSLQQIDASSYVVPLLGNKLNSRPLGWNFKQGGGGLASVLPLSGDLEGRSDAKTQDFQAQDEPTESAGADTRLLQWYTGHGNNGAVLRCAHVIVGKGVTLLRSSPFCSATHFGRCSEQLAAMECADSPSLSSPSASVGNVRFGCLRWGMFSHLVEKEAANQGIVVGSLKAEGQATCLCVEERNETGSVCELLLSNKETGVDSVVLRERMRSVDHRAVNAFVVSLFCGSSCVAHCSTVHRKRWLVAQLIVALSRMPRGGALVCEMACVVECFYAGLVRLLSRVFQRFTVVALPWRRVNIACVCFASFRGTCADVLMHLELIETRLVEVEADFDVLHVAPIEELMDDEFVAFLRSANEAVFESVVSL